MRIFYTILIGLFSLNSALAQFSKSKQEAFEIAEKAIEKMHEGKYQEAINLLEVSEELDPKSISYTYEKAYAYYYMEDFQTASDVLVGIIDHKQSNELIYQLLGICYEHLGKDDQAIETYYAGLVKFPNSGELYFELGMIEYRKSNFEEAVKLWEKGVASDPNFASNYYWLCRHYATTDEKAWSILYSEIFLNLERNTDRTDEVSHLLFDTYQSVFELTSDNTAKVNLTSKMQIDPKKSTSIPFPVAFDLTVTMSIPFETIKEDGRITIKALHELRLKFIENWIAHKQDKTYPNALFDFHIKLIEDGQFEPYNYWVFLKGGEDDFWDWFDTNEEKYKQFASWFNGQQIFFDSKNVVVNTAYSD